MPVTVVTTTEEIVVPVTVVTTTEAITLPVQPGITQTVAISVPHVTVHDLVTVTETVTKSFTVEPDPVDVATQGTLRLAYDHTTPHLLRSWGVLLGSSVSSASSAWLFSDARTSVEGRDGARRPGEDGFVPPTGNRLSGYRRASHHRRLHVWLCRGGP